MRLVLLKLLEMSKQKQLGIETRGLIIYITGKSNPETTKELKLNNTTVNYNVKKYRESGDQERKHLLKIM